MNTIKKHRENLLYLTIATVYVLFFMVNYSPLYSGCIIESGKTSVESIVIGKYIFQGGVPYKDLFGTSGPFVYFIESVGWLSQIRTSGMIIQIFMLFLLLVGTHHLLSKRISYKRAVLLTSISMIFWLAVFSAGNTEGVLGLNIVIWMLVICEKEQMKERVKSVLLGVLCSLALMVNLNTAIICLLIIYGYYLEYQSKMDVRQTLIYLCGVCCIVIAPVLIYFFVNHGLSEFLEAYMIEAKMLLNGFSTLNEVVRKIIKCIPILFYLVIEILSLKKEDIKSSYLQMFSAIGFLVAFFFSDVTWDKCGVVYIALLMSVACISGINKKKRCIFQSIFLLIGFLIFAIPIKNYLIDFNEYYLNKYYVKENEKLEKWLTEEGDSLNEEIIMVDLPVKYYLILDKKPAYRYFDRQTELCAYSMKVSYGILDYIQKSNIQWLFVNGKGWIEEHIGPYNLTDYWELDSHIAVYQHVDS